MKGRMLMRPFTFTLARGFAARDVSGAAHQERTGTLLADVFERDWRRQILPPLTSAATVRHHWEE